MIARALPVLRDGYARTLSYLRISLTDRCNYRCTYCMPAEGVQLLPREDVLRFEEIATIVAALVPAGVRRVRLTGGEPTVRKDLVDLVRQLSALDLDDLALSTNGEALTELAAPLRAAGLRRLNVSLDTLDPEKFRHITRRGHLERVLAGLDAASAAGFRHTKLNTVAMAGFNDDEIGRICRYAWERGMVPRFIELMPMADGALFYPGSFLGAQRIREILKEEFVSVSVSVSDHVNVNVDVGVDADADADGMPGAGPARYHRVHWQGAWHPVGIISPVTEPFCATCNRVRLSATGRLHTCLGRDESTDLRPLVRSGLPPAGLHPRLREAVQAALSSKAAGHTFSPTGCGGPQKYMVTIGG